MMRMLDHHMGVPVESRTRWLSSHKDKLQAATQDSHLSIVKSSEAILTHPHIFILLHMAA